AACHGCALVAETSCEMRNDYLDRALVVPVRLIPMLMAICRSLTPRACFNRRTSRTFRIGALSAGIGPPLPWSQRGAGPRFDRRLRELQAGRNRVAGTVVAYFRRNRWSGCVGMRSRLPSDYALTSIVVA